MKSNSYGVLAAAALLGCTMNSSAPVTAWGKKDVSMLDYRTDAGQCAVLAATTSTNTNVSKTAGGIDGTSTPMPKQQASGSADAASGRSNNTATSGAEPLGSGTYRDAAPADYVNRAAMQQRSQEMAEQRARHDALKSCLVSRGYTEFQLTTDQRTQLSKLKQGSDERRDYLYKLGTDPGVLQNQRIRHADDAPPAPGS